MKGFTLIEVIVALTVGLIIATAARQVFEAVSQVSGHLESSTVSAGRTANGARLLRRLIGSIDVGTNTAAGFSGSSHRALFRARIAGPDGQARLINVLLLAEVPDLSVAIGRDTVLLSDGIESCVLEYLAAPGAHQPWLSEWSSAVTAPVAVRLRRATEGVVDTLLFSVGPRG